MCTHAHLLRKRHRVGAADACTTCVRGMIKALVALLARKASFMTWLAVRRSVITTLTQNTPHECKPPHCKPRHECSSASQERNHGSDHDHNTSPA